MNHSEAVGQMAAERYLLDELPPELREAFEEHVFECRECALDLRAGAAFVDEAKLQLPDLTPSAQASPAARRAPERKRPWFSWLSPAFALPAMAVLAAIIVYQNVATIPALRSSDNQPALVPWTSVHVGTRGGAPSSVVADRVHGVVLLVDLPQLGVYASYSFVLFDASGKEAWKSGVVSPAPGEGGTVSLLIPGNGLQPGAYTLAVSGILSSGQTTELGRRSLDIGFAIQ